MWGDPYGTVDGHDQMERMLVDTVSGSFFATLGVEPVLGRGLTEADDNSEGDHPVAVISYGWWQRTFAGDPNVLGHRVKIGETTFNIIGVAPPGFFGINVGHQPDLWIPFSMVKSILLMRMRTKDNSLFQSNLILWR